MREVILRGFPLPPSMNNVYSNAAGRGRVKNSAYKSYEAQVQWWMLHNAQALNSVREWAKTVPAGHGFRLDRLFHFLPHRILTKAGTPRKNDTTNRIKVLDDVLAKILWIDDSLFWSGSEDKCPIPTQGMVEGVDVRFSFVNLSEYRSIGEVDQ